jgi:hypothetical protein
MNNNEPTCAICLEGFKKGYQGIQEPFQASCKHKFHPRCIKDWIDIDPIKEQTCPMCRKESITSNYKEFKQKSVKHKVVNGKWELKTWKNTPKNWMNTTSSLYRQVPSATAIATAIRSGLSDYRKVDARVIAALGVGAAIGLNYAF